MRPSNTIHVAGTLGTDWLVRIPSTAGASLTLQKVKQPLLARSIRAHPFYLLWLPWVQTMGSRCALKSLLSSTEQNPDKASQETTPKHSHAHCLQEELQPSLGVPSQLS